MKEGLGFIKIKNYAVINLNNMFPSPKNEIQYVDINKQHDQQYKALLLAEYRVIKSKQEKIFKNAAILYKIKLKDGDSSPLSKRCNDFVALEKACIEYQNQ